MKLSDVAIGQKFIHKGKAYIRVDMNVSDMFKTLNLTDSVTVLDLYTYKVMVMYKKYEVESYEYPVTAQWVKPTEVSQEFCSNCMKTPKTVFGILPDFCPNCGERMKKEVRKVYKE